MIGKLKKILAIYLTLFIALTNFSVVFADETEEIENNDEETQEIEQEQEQEQQEIIVNYENQNQLNNIENNINDINNELNEIKPLLKSTINVGRNKCLNFDNFTKQQLEHFYNHYNDFEFVYLNKGSNGNNAGVHYCYVNQIDDFTANNYRQITINPNGTLSDSGIITDIYVLNLNSNNDDWGFVRFNANISKYNLQPFQLNIINNGLGEITNSVNIEPYISTNIYYNGQSITLTYNNSNNDFNGWYKNGNYVSNNLSYTFNIDTDTTIEINKYIEPIESDTYTMILACIFICLLFITFKSLIWGV